MGEWLTVSMTNLFFLGLEVDCFGLGNIGAVGTVGVSSMPTVSGVGALDTVASELIGSDILSKETQRDVSE